MGRTRRGVVDPTRHYNQKENHMTTTAQRVSVSDALQARITEINRDLAEALQIVTGQAWQRTDRPERTQQYMVAPDGFTVTLCGTYPYSHIEIFMCAEGEERYLPRDTKRTIRVAASRTAVQIAKEISRRMLPTLRPLWKEALSAYQQDQLRERLRAAHQQDLIANGAAASWREHYITNRPGAPYFTASVEQNGVYFEKIGGIGFEKAKRIIAILNEQTEL